MERQYTHDSQIIYVDPKGRKHAAIVTAWWGAPNASYDGEIMGTMSETLPPGSKPGCNLVYVATEIDKKDPYGRQIERATSVVHKSRQAAPANFWCWPDEL